MRLQSLADTRRLAHELVTALPAGSLLLLSGELGAGKTTLTQAIGEALGTSAKVSSPTYTLIHEYPTHEGLLVHIDAYRLPTAESLFSLGLDDYLERARLVVVEWGEALLTHYQDATLVRLSLDGDQRSAQVSYGKTV